jgi:hypothetical protein
MKSSGSGVENETKAVGTRCTDQATHIDHQNVALTSPTAGYLIVIFHMRTKGRGFLCNCLFPYD